jgi:DNA polymerase-3 subunit delta
MRKVTSGAIDKILEDLKENNLFVLYGEERFFSDEVLKKIEYKVFKDKAEKDLNFHQYSGLENNISEVLASCLSFPMLSSHKMVVLKDFDKIKLIDKDNFIKYIKHPQPTTILVLTAERWGSTKFHQEIMNHALAVRCGTLSSGEIYAWVDRKLKQAKIDSDKDSIVFLIENIGNNLLRLNLEIEKIVNYLGPEKSLTLEVVSQLTGFTREVNIFYFQKVLASRDLKGSLKIGIELLEQGNPLVAILPMVFIFFRRIWVVKHLKAQKYTQDQILKKLGGSKFAYSDVFASAGNFSNQQLISIMELLEEAEVQLKTSQKPSHSILTMLCYHICQNEKN